MSIVQVDINKFREITKKRLREDRTQLFVNQDVAFQRALETGADTAAIVDEKQRLRDLPNLADSAQTLEQLRAIKVTD